MDEGNVLNDVLQRTLNFIDHGFGLIQGDVYWLFATLLLINLTLAGLAWAFSEEEMLSALARRVLYIGFFAWLVMNWPTLIDTVGQGFVHLGIKAGNATITDQQFYNPGKVVGTGWSGAWNMVQAATKLTGVRATFVNLPQILIIMLAAIIYFIAFCMLAFQIFLALVQFKAGALASFVLLPMALLNKTVFLAERPIGWLIASGIRLMVLALVMALGLDLVQSVASVPADALTIRQAVAAALGAVSLFLLARMATAMSGDLVSGSPSLGIDGGSAIGPAARATRSAAGNAAATARGAAPYAGRALRWGAMAVASLVPGGGAAATVGRAAVSTVNAAGSSKDAGAASSPIRVSVRRRMTQSAPAGLLPGPSQA